MAPLRIIRLEAWLRQAQARDWVDGDWDCLMAPCHWAAVLTGQDPAAKWRGTYASAEEAEANLAAGGGMARLVDRTLRAQGWVRTRRPEPGDFGVVTLPGLRTRFGAVRYGAKWAIATSDGMLLTNARARGAWRWPGGVEWPTS